MGLALGVLAVAMAVGHAVPGAHLAVGLGMAASLMAIARVEGVSAAELGLARSTWGSGLRWGAGVAGLVAVGYGLAYLVPAVRQVLGDGKGDLGWGVLWAILVVVPLATVVPEELAFRGLLLALLGRRRGLRAATLLSSALFGVWHVVGALGGGAANAAITSVVGGDAAGTVVRVVVTVVFTSLAGIVLCGLRLRSGSLLAPMLAHWAVNGLGVIVALVA